MTTQSIEGAMPPLPEPYQREIYATAENTTSVRKGYEMGGYVKVPDLFTAEHLEEYAKAYAAPLLARVAELEADARRLDYLLLMVSGKEFRRIGVHYSGNAQRADIDAALAAKEQQP